MRMLQRQTCTPCARLHCRPCPALLCLLRLCTRTHPVRRVSGAAASWRRPRRRRRQGVGSSRHGARRRQRGHSPGPWRPVRRAGAPGVPAGRDEVPGDARERAGGRAGRAALPLRRHFHDPAVSLAVGGLLPGSQCRQRSGRDEAAARRLQQQHAGDGQAHTQAGMHSTRRTHARPSALSLSPPRSACLPASLTRARAAVASVCVSVTHTPSRAPGRYMDKGRDCVEQGKLYARLLGALGRAGLRV